MSAGNHDRTGRSPAVARSSDIGRPGDDAAGLVAGAAERDILEVATNIGAGRHLETEAGQIGCDDTVSDVGIAVDFLGNQLPQRLRSLRMPDEDHAATVIVMLQVVAPGGPNVVVGEVVRQALFGETGDGELPVSRRKQQASTGKRRGLKERGPEFLLTAPPGVGGSSAVAAEGCPAVISNGTTSERMGRTRWKVKALCKRFMADDLAQWE